MTTENRQQLSANIVNIEQRTIRYGTLEWQGGKIVALREDGAERPGAPYLMPGFIDAHIHIESSMLPPAEFSRAAVVHGTVATVSDPHEIANVVGADGVRWMLADARRAACKIHFTLPSCVPATPFETAGARLDSDELEALVGSAGVVGLSEMMNFPGVLANDAEVAAKLALARRHRLPVDGHAPGVRGEQAQRYAAAGISTDHECFTLEEALEKIAAGMTIQIREGSAARNFEALHPLLTLHPDKVMFCSDDKHPDDLMAGHIDRLVARAVAAGHDLFDVLRCACLTPVEHYRLPVGRLRPGDTMDGVLVANLRDFAVLRTWVDGRLVAQEGRCLSPHQAPPAINRFVAGPIQPSQLTVSDAGETLRVIEALDGELITRQLVLPAQRIAGCVEPDPSRDLLMLVVVNRYQNTPPAIAFIKGFGLQRGAMASSVAHDSHNLIAVGSSREALASALNAVIANRGGIAVADDASVATLPLPIAGLMSDAPCSIVAERYAALDRRAKALGSPLRAPFMTLSFMALLVIPELKLSDRGLFDGRRFAFTPLLEERAS